MHCLAWHVGVSFGVSWPVWFMARHFISTPFGQGAGIANLETDGHDCGQADRAPSTGAPSYSTSLQVADRLDFPDAGNRS
jgi:hypothetical protein